MSRGIPVDLRKQKQLGMYSVSIQYRHVNDMTDTQRQTQAVVNTR